jgi:hypothetical protein
VGGHVKIGLCTAIGIGASGHLKVVIEIIERQNQ